MYTTGPQRSQAYDLRVLSPAGLRAGGGGGCERHEGRRPCDRRSTRRRPGAQAAMLRPAGR